MNSLRKRAAPCCDGGPNHVGEALLADGEFGELGDEVPRFVVQGLVADALTLKCVGADEFEERLEVGVWGGCGLRLRVQVDEEVEVSREAGRGGAQATCVFLWDGVGGRRRERGEVALYAGEEDFQVPYVCCADCEARYVRARVRIQHPVPHHAVGAEFAVRGARTLGVVHVRERVQQAQVAAALLVGEQPREADPRAAEVAEALDGALVAPRLLEAAREGRVGEDGVEARGADVEVAVPGERVPVVVAVCGGWAGTCGEGSVDEGSVDEGLGFGAAGGAAVFGAARIEAALGVGAAGAAASWAGDFVAGRSRSSRPFTAVVVALAGGRRDGWRGYARYVSKELLLSRGRDARVVELVVLLWGHPDSGVVVVYRVWEGVARPDGRGALDVNPGRRDLYSLMSA